MTPIEALRFSDRDLIESIIENYFILDFGFISKVNDDGTVNVIHAKKGVTIDGQELPETETRNMELLTISCAEFSIQLKPKAGDNVLLLGLKNYIKKAGGISQASKNEIFIHYQQNTMKAVPLSLFDSDAKVKIELDSGDLNLITDGKVNIKCNEAEIRCSGFKVSDSNGTAALEVTP